METLLNVDLEVFKIINDLNLGFLERFIVLIRYPETWIPLYIALIAFMIYRWRRLAWLPILFSVLTVACSDYTSSELIKKSVERPRPCHTIERMELRVSCGTGYSFTSSHATSHMALAIFWFQLFGMWRAHRWWLILWAVLIGFAQIYVGVHYPVDVLGGFLVGGMIGLITYLLYQKIHQKIYPKVRE